MKRIVCLLLAVLMSLMTLCACVKTTAQEPETTAVENVSTSLTPDTFDAQLLAYIAEHTDGNYMVSPLSFRYALGLLLAGAEGDTKTELLTALGVANEEEWAKACTTFNGFIEQFDEQLQEEIDEYRDGVKRGYYDEGEEPFRALRVANSIWKREDITADFKETYCDKIEKWYVAEYKSFTVRDAVQKINAWASEKTEKMIEKLLPDEYDTDSLAVVLMNALYFKDAWSEKFQSAWTKDGTFTTKSGATVTKTFMTQTERHAYYEDDDTQLVILPMEGGVYMAFVLGDTSGLSQKIAAAENYTVKVTIPKIDLETSFSGGELVDFLKQYGVRKAFTDEADFSGMMDYDIFVSDIIQKTRIKLDEDGVEAAAVTAIMMKNSSMPDTTEPKTFTADRPFSFYIYTTVNDITEILFSGQIVE